MKQIERIKRDIKHKKYMEEEMKKSHKCSVPGCKRDIVIRKHALCKSHAARLYRLGNVGSPEFQKHKRIRPLKLRDSDKRVG